MRLPNATDLANTAVENTKSKLTRRLREEDPSLLLLHKEIVDSYFIPCLLLRELGDPKTVDWCRVLHESYSDTRLSELVEGGVAARDEIRNATTRYSLEGRRSAIFSVVERSYLYAGEDYPTMLWIQGHVTSRGCAIRVQTYEPYFANRDLQFPVHPERCEIYCSDSRIQLRESRSLRPTFDEQVRPGSPVVLNNPFGIYTIFDSLRPFVADFGHSPEVIASCVPKDASDSGTVRIITTSPDRPSPSRISRVSLKNRVLRAISIQQHPVMVRRNDPFAYSITGVANNKTVMTETYTPYVDVTYLSGGRDVDIDFGDELPAGRIRVVITRDHQARFAAEIRNLSYSSCDVSPTLTREDARADLIEADHRLHDVYNAIDNHIAYWKGTLYTAGELDGRIAGNLLRARLKYNVYAALVARDFVIVNDALQRYQALLDREGVDVDMYVYSIESLTQACFDFFGDKVGCEFADTFLVPAYRAILPSRMTEHVIRLLSQYRYGFALLALDAARHQRPADACWARGAADRVVSRIRADAENSLIDPAFPYLPRIAHANRALDRFRSGALGS